MKWLQPQNYLYDVVVVPLTIMNYPETQAAKTIAGSIESAGMNLETVHLDTLYVHSDAASMRHTVVLNGLQFIPRYLSKS